LDFVVFRSGDSAAFTAAAPVGDVEAGFLDALVDAFLALVAFDLVGDLDTATYTTSSSCLLNAFPGDLCDDSGIYASLRGELGAFPIGPTLLPYLTGDRVGEP